MSLHLYAYLTLLGLMSTACYLASALTLGETCHSFLMNGGRELLFSVIMFWLITLGTTCYAQYVIRDIEGRESLLPQNVEEYTRVMLLWLLVAALSSLQIGAMCLLF